MNSEFQEITKCKICGSNNYEKTFLKKGTWVGTKSHPLEFFRKSEFDFGWDYYAKEDLRVCLCSCGYVWYESAVEPPKTNAKLESKEVASSHNASLSKEEKDLRLAELEAQIKAMPISLINSLAPMVFDSPEELHAKAKELDVFIGQSDDINLLDRVGSMLFSIKGHRLFYFKKEFWLKKELDSLKSCVSYRQFGLDIPNLYIFGSPHKGIVYIVENLNREIKN